MDIKFRSHRLALSHTKVLTPGVEFKEFEPRLKFETGLKYSWFPLSKYSMFQDLSRPSIETGFWRISLNSDSQYLIDDNLLLPVF